MCCDCVDCGGVVQFVVICVLCAGIGGFFVFRATSFKTFGFCVASHQRFA